MDVNKLLIDLVNIESISGNETRIGQFIYDLLQKEGFNVEKNMVDGTTFNIIATLGTPRIILASHMDTVTPFIPAKENNTTISGRGSCDAKASIASMIVASVKSKEQGLTNFGMIFTVGEETNFRGVKQLIKSKIKMPFVIVGEPTSLDIVNGHFGILVLKLLAFGKTAHSSTPEKGDNAIEKLLKVLTKLQGLELNHKTIMSLCKIKGGEADNIIPAQAEATLSFRIDTDDKTDYVKIIKNIVGKSVEVHPSLSSVGIVTKVPKQFSFIKRVRTVKYGTELFFYKNGVVIGPGNIDCAHSKGEKISKKELLKAVDVYSQIIKNYQK